MKIFPTKNEQELLLKECAQHRWYYNAYLDTFDIAAHMETVHEAIKEKVKYAPSINWKTLQPSLTGFTYLEEKQNRTIFCQFVPNNQTCRSYPKPSWIETTQGTHVDPDAHNRVIRGACANFTQNLNSAVSNYFNDNIDEFTLHWKTARDKHEFVNFTDGCYPAFHKTLKGSYFYRLPVGESKRRTSISWTELLSIHKTMGFCILQDKQTKCWYACLPVERDWFPPSDHRSENQGNVIRGGAIGLDPGMRKFLSGYSTTGESLFMGNRAFKTLIPLLFHINRIEGRLKRHRNKLQLVDERELAILVRRKQKLWERVKNLVREMHWKCAKFLVKNYEHIYLGDFRVKNVTKHRKGKKDLPALVKRILQQYSFFSFKQRLEYLCERNNCKLILVHEALTSKSCSSCGNVGEVGKSEVYKCLRCGGSFDRDGNSAKNILVKGMSVLNSRVEESST
jgi:putative transposase